MQITQDFLTPNNWSRPLAKLNKVKGIVIHWVGNAGSSAKANRDYFNNIPKSKEPRYASSHYIIGLNGEIIQCIPETEIAYHASEANQDHIGIENCHPDWDGKFNDKTYNSLVELCADICSRYNLNPLTDIKRHYDITKKMCPKYYVEHKEAFVKLKQDVHFKLDSSKRMKIIIDGVPTYVEALIENGVTKVKLRDLESEHIHIGYENGIPTITTN